MTTIIEKSNINGKINAIPSKSYAHRIAICSFLAGNENLVDCGEFSSKDILATVGCLKALRENRSILDCVESGSTLRFMLPLTSAIGGNFTFIGQGRLMERPNEELFTVLREHGIKIDKTDKIEISGKLTSGEYKIRGDISSQYISGLLMALPILEGDSKITLTSPLLSAPYVDITIEVLQSFGINIVKTKDGFLIKGNQKFKGEVLPEGDWSNMAFFLCAGAIGGEVTVSGLNPLSKQGDKFILEILKKFGALISVNGDEVFVKKDKLLPFTYSATNCPDLVPITAVLASFADGKSVITDVERLKIKESDRIESTISMLNAFNVEATSDGHSLIIYGKNAKNGKVNSFNDHRIAMASAIAGLFLDGKTKIFDAEAVNKSYPSFFKDLEKLGGKVSAI